MSKLVLPLTMLAAMIACSDDPGELPGDTGATADSGSQDSGRHDTGVSDSGLADSGDHDSGVSDSGFDSGFDSGVLDLGFADSGEEDAGPSDGGLMCNGVGDRCTGGDPCPNGLMCGLNDVCVPPPTCGGFVMARCMAPRGICMYYQGADYGPCFTPLEQACVCADPVIASYFPDC